ncbi:MAG: glycoside hydrolase family 3 N-terminal domain-containing protein [Nakamurella sp.]
MHTQQIKGAVAMQVRARSERRWNRRWAAVISAVLVLRMVGVKAPSAAWSADPAASTPDGAAPDSTTSVTADANGAAGAASAWLDAGRSIPDRVQALLRKMTLPEKVGQMDQQLVSTLSDTDGSRCQDSTFTLPNTSCMQKILIEQNTGSVLAGGTTTPTDTTGQGGVGNTGLDWANQYNAIQGYAIANSRLHIPLLFGIDAVHGFGHPWQAPLFPHSIGIGATWDPAMARTGGVVTAQATRATGWNWVFAPVQDLARDNRWGRTYETWSEQPVLASALGAANVKGLQAKKSPRNSLQVAATIKHFAGYSQSINGHDRNEALLPLSYLQSTILPGYAGGIDAGAMTVMANSGSINAVPATASHYLLTDILRGQMGFDGVVISDYQDVPALQTAYHVAADLPGAIAKAVNAGVDMSMQVFDAAAWQTAALQAVQSGAISQSRIDEAVGRILTLKFKLGLFEQPCIRQYNTPCVDAAAADDVVTAGRAEVLKATQESITLLRNDNNVLPLPADSKVVVTGPSADSMTNQLGGWSVSWQGVYGAGHVCCMGPADQIPPGSTVRTGVLAANTNAVYAADQDAALAQADGASAYVVAVGERAYAEGLGDDPAPALPADQQALISALEATGVPVIVVVLAGRPVGLGSAATAAGIVMAYQGSTEAGEAVADVLFGTVNPSGKLPISWPSDAAAVGGDFDGTAPSPLGDQPKFFDQLPGTGSGPGHAYNPAYPFGFGLSYTSFTHSALSVTANVSAKGSGRATFIATNSGSVDGTDIIPLYVNQPVSDVVTPPQRLVGFTRIDLKAGESKPVVVRFPLTALGVSAGDIDAAGPPTVQKGDYVLQLNKNTTTPYEVELSAPFTVR